MLNHLIRIEINQIMRGNHMGSNPIHNHSISLYTLLFWIILMWSIINQMCMMLGGISTKSAYKLLQADRIKHFKIVWAYRIPEDTHYCLPSIPYANRRTQTL